MFWDAVLAPLRTGRADVRWHFDAQREIHRRTWAGSPPPRPAGRNRYWSGLSATPSTADGGTPPATPQV